jgi:positive regulator of sigma E activity
MAAPYKFLLRLIVAVVMAFLIGRIFFQGITAGRVVILALVLLALAYVFEYARRHDK